MVAAGQEPHQNEKQDHQNEGLGKTDQDAGERDAGDADGHQLAGVDPVGEPARRKLAETVGEREGRDDEARLRVVQVEGAADEGDERHGDRRQDMVAEVPHDEQGQHPPEDCTQLQWMVLLPLPAVPREGIEMILRIAENRVLRQC